MSVQKALYRQYLLAVHLWPVDPLRPNVSFRETLFRRMQAYFGKTVEADSTLPTQSSPQPSSTGNVEAGGKPVIKFDKAVAEKELNALGALLEDRFKKTYPVSDTILRPRSKPDYYENLLKELDQAPQRSWWETKLNSFKGWIRIE